MLKAWLTTNGARKKTMIETAMIMTMIETDGNDKMKVLCNVYLDRIALCILKKKTKQRDCNINILV